ncbi:MAG: alpha/beta hydrolase [Sulfurimonas sp.]|nr:MAG: alpha/beta hydrolase [Sulfurimonas sp.]
MIYIAFLFFLFFILAISFYHLQYFMMFKPTYYRSTELDDRFEVLSITTNDGVELEGVVYKAHNHKATMLFFSGRFHDGVGAIEKMSYAYPDIRIIIFNYRSYGRSGGKLNEKNIFSDALHITRIIKKNFGDIYVAGFSLGSSIASYVASVESVTSVFLIGPFDSIGKITKMKYGINLALISRYKFDNTKFVQKIEADTYIFSSKADNVSYINNVRNLKTYVKNLVYYKEFEDLTHNELLFNEDIVKEISGFIR